MNCSEKEFDELVDELVELCFEIESGDYYCDRCLEFDDVIEILQNKLLNKGNELI